MGGALNFLDALIKSLHRVWRGGLSLELRVKFPCIHESPNFLEPFLVTMNV